MAQLLKTLRNAGDLGSIPGLGKSTGEGKGYPHQYSGLENSMDYIVYGIAKSQTWLSDWHYFTYIYSCSSGSATKESTYNTGDLGLIPGLGRFPGQGKGYPHQYSGLENSMDCIVNWVAKRVTFTSLHNWTTFTSLSSSCSKKYIHYLFFSRNSFPEGYFFLFGLKSFDVFISEKNI